LWLQSVYCKQLWRSSGRQVHQLEHIQLLSRSASRWLP
jgi:hypothetical protein